MDLIELATDSVRCRGLQLPPAIGRRGVYRLTFGDGNRYIGRTDDMIVRMGGHFRTYEDIIGISFLPISSGDLDSALAALEALVGRSTRSHVGGATTSSTNNAETVTDPCLSRLDWIESQFADSQLHRRPPEPPDQRERTRPQFERLAAHPDFASLQGLVHRYLDRVVVVPRATERRNWVITSMPSTARTKVWHRLLCLSINNVEALTIGEQLVGDHWTVAGFMSAAAPRGPRPADLPRSAVRSGAFDAPAHYRTLGDLSQIGFDSLAALSPLLDSDRVLDRAGELAMRLMRRGRGMYGRFHDYNLADAVLSV